jgi:hypothetical protein
MEGNLPTYFSSLILMIAAILLFLSGKLAHIKVRKKWFLLASIFTFMSLDEAAQIHEKLLYATNQLIGNVENHALTWVWVVPYALVMVPVVIYLLPWVISLPAKTRNSFFTSGFIYVLGVLVIELFEGFAGKNYGWDHYFTITCYTIQEILEMTGIILFIDAILQHISRLQQGNNLLLHFIGGPSVPGVMEQPGQSLVVRQ